MKIVEEAEVRERLTTEVCMKLMREGLKQLETGEALQPIRCVNGIPGGNSFGFMPAWMDDYFGAKIITAFHGNLGTEYPSHMGYVMMFDSKHGSPVGMADCSSITEIRTGAVSGVATDLLARKDARVLAMIGCGAQGRSHLAAMMQVRHIEQVYCYDIVPECAQKYAEEQSKKYGVKVVAVNSVEEAVKNADIICTVTPSKDPYLTRNMVKPGVHINAVGTFTPVTREVSSDLIAASRLYADQVEAMKKESGEYLTPLEEGLITEAHIQGSIGGVLCGKVQGRITEDEITVFDALGLAIEDVICGKYLVCE